MNKEFNKSLYSNHKYKILLFFVLAAMVALFFHFRKKQSLNNNISNNTNNISSIPYSNYSTLNPNFTAAYMQNSPVTPFNYNPPISNSVLYYNPATNTFSSTQSDAAPTNSTQALNFPNIAPNFSSINNTNQSCGCGNNKGVNNVLNSLNSYISALNNTDQTYANNLNNLYN